MNVEIVAATPYPIDAISLAAGTCYGKSDYPKKRALNCYKSGHMSVFEHASVTFKASGISRSCSHQLVRHRIASFSQESQRYCKVDVDGHDWYVKPPSFDAVESADSLEVLGMDKDEFFYACIREAEANYRDALKVGIKPEDARYLLPEACKTNIVVTMNARELFHFLDLRQGNGAQWEIHELADEVERAVADMGGQWCELMALRTERE